MFNIMTPSDVSVSSPLRNSQDVNFPGEVIMKHWFKFHSQGENGKSIHECNKCSARVKWQGKKFGYKTFSQHVKKSIFIHLEVFLINYLAISQS